MTTNITGVTGTHTVNGRPTGSTSLTPFIVVPRAGEAISFYCEIFGARLVDKTEFDGVVAHAELDFGNGRLQLGEASAAYGLSNAPEGEADCYSLGLYCPDVDAVVARAEAAGARIREATTTFVSGDRFASIRDPFGIRWSVLTRVEDLSEADSAARRGPGGGPPEGG
ncbi:MAG: VOC family protein, partial [Gordonia sp. (in: high G+C Gram-positive bacteria)]